MLEAARSSLRQIRGHPGFAGAVIVTLALSVGATTAVFILADPMLFRPLPYPEPDRLVRISATGGEGRYGGRVLLADFERLAANHPGFEAVAQFGLAALGSIDGMDATVLAYDVSPGFFDVLRVRPVLGRAFLPGEHLTGAQGPEVALITHALWQAAFGGDPAVVGQTLELAGPRTARYRVVGVLPRDFVVPDHVNEPPKILVPRAVDPAGISDPRFGSRPIARLRSDVPIGAATALTQAVLTAVEREHPSFPQGRMARLVPLHEDLFGSVRTPLIMLLAATGCVLVLACANLAHLFMARLQARRRELGIRLACGAGRWRLTRLLVTEAAALAVLGGLAALLIGGWTFNVLMAQMPYFAHVYRLLPAELDWRVAGFAAVLVTGALMVFGVLPAFRAARADVRDSLQSGGSSEPSRIGVRSDALLIVTQTAVSFSLLVTGALIVGSYVALAFQPARLPAAAGAGDRYRADTGGRRHAGRRGPGADTPPHLRAVARAASRARDGCRRDSRAHAATAPGAGRQSDGSPPCRRVPGEQHVLRRVRDRAPARPAVRRRRGVLECPGRRGRPADRGVALAGRGRLRAAGP